MQQQIFLLFAAAAKSLPLCPTLCNATDGSPPGPAVPGILQASTLEWKWSCHFLLQCMKVKSESEVAQSCPTLSDPMDCSLPGSSVLIEVPVIFSKTSQSMSLQNPTKQTKWHYGYKYRRQFIIFFKILDFTREFF